MTKKKQVEKPVEPEPSVTVTGDVPQAGVSYSALPEPTYTVSAPTPIVEPVVESVVTGITPREPLTFVPGEPPNVKPVKEPETVMVEVLTGAISIEWPIDVLPYKGSKRFVKGNRLEMPFARAKRLEQENSVRIV